MNYRGILVLGLLSFALFLNGCGEKTAPISPANQISHTYFVQVNGLNLRECPSTKCEIITVLEAGTGMTVLTKGNGWLEVQVHNSRKRGWLSARYVSRNPPAATEKKSKRAKVVPKIPEEEFALSSHGSEPPQITEEFGPVDNTTLHQDDLSEAPPIKEEFAE